MSSVLTQSRPTKTTELAGGESLIDQFTDLIADPDRRPVAANVLRALTRPLLRAIGTMRHEPIEPYERALGFASRVISADIEPEVESLTQVESVTDQPLYLLGRIEALLDLCDMAIDRSISTATVEQARRRRHVRQILEQLVNCKEMSASLLADAVGISRQQLSNLLVWMEATDLIRRATAGRSTLVSLGPKGDAVYAALDGPDPIAFGPDKIAPVDFKVLPGADCGDVQGS